MAALGGGGALLIAPPEVAEASHQYSVIAVYQAEAYRHVLETDDRLFLARYGLTDVPPTGESANGADYAVARVENAGTVYRQARPPVGSYAVFAFYFTAAETAALAIPWNNVAVEVCLQEDPLVFASPAESCASSAPASGLLTWNSTGSVSATGTELGNDLKRLLQLLETDAGLTAGTYVTSAGITAAGSILLGLAFPYFTQVSPAAFLAGSEPAGGGYAPGTPIPGGAAIPRITQDFESAVPAGAAAASVVLAAPHYYVDTTGMTVTRSGHGDITPSCALGGDRRTVSCAGLAVDPAATDLTVAYYSEHAGANSPFGQDVRNFFETFGIPGVVGGMGLVALMVGGLALLARWAARKPAGVFVAIYSVPALLLWGALAMEIPPLYLSYTLIAIGASIGSAGALRNWLS